MFVQDRLYCGALPPLDSSDSGESHEQKGLEDNNRKMIYVNITVLDASEAVRHKVSEKILRQSKMPSQIRKAVAKGASNVAVNRYASVTKSAEKLSSKMCDLIKQKMKKKGITISAKVVFLKAAYFVLQLQVQHCDAVVLADATSNDKNTQSWGIVKWVFGIMGTGATERIERSILPGIVQRTLNKTMSEILQEKLTQNRMVAIVETLPEEMQARYFFAQLEGIRP